MVARVVDAGHDVVALGRSAENLAAIAQLGANAVADTVEATAHADTVVVCVFTDEQVRQI